MTVANPPTRREIRQTIELALARLENTETWCQRVACLDKDGQPCEPFDAGARRWCASTHLLVAEDQVCGKRAADRQHPIWTLLHRRLGSFAEMARINDEEGIEAVRTFFREMLMELAPRE